MNAYLMNVTESYYVIMKNFVCFSLGPFDAATGGEMVSRRRILSRSRDDLTQAFAPQVEEEEDVWYQKDKLYKVRKQQNV